MIDLLSLGIIEGYSGLLFVGDTHLSSRKPGRRLDGYSDQVLKKIRFAAATSREQNLFAIQVGDLFHRPRENDLELLNDTTDACREFGHTLPVLGGSHDHSEDNFTARDAATMVAKTHAITLISNPGLFAKFRIEGRIVGLWAAPHGVPLPDSLPDAGTDINILVTHHDLDFNGPYPGCHNLKEIENCHMLVNGHMHTPTPMVIKGQTVCHNPGSLTRVAISERKHTPVVSAWAPSMGASLEKIAVPFEPNVFDLQGYEAWAADDKTLKASMAPSLKLSNFAEKWRQRSALGANRTDDGSVVAKQLEMYYEVNGTSENAKRYISSLLQTILDRQAS